MKIKNGLNVILVALVLGAGSTSLSQVYYENYPESGGYPPPGTWNRTVTYTDVYTESGWNDERGRGDYAYNCAPAVSSSNLEKVDKLLESLLNDPLFNNPSDQQKEFIRKAHFVLGIKPPYEKLEAKSIREKEIAHYQKEKIDAYALLLFGTSDVGPSLENPSESQLAEHRKQSSANLYRLRYSRSFYDTDPEVIKIRNQIKDVNHLDDNQLKAIVEIVIESTKHKKDKMSRKSN